MSLILFGKKITGHWTREIRRELRIHTQHTADILDGKDTREMFDQVYFIYHAKGGTVYRFAPFMDNPERDDYPLAVLGDGFTKGKGGTGPKSYSVNLCQVEYADGFKEWQSCTISEPQEQALDSMEAISLDVEAAYLKECENAFPDTKNPTMQEFYTVYVKQRKTQTEMVRLGLGSRGTLNNRRKKLEGHMIRKGIHYTLDQLRNNEDLREARKKQADLRRGKYRL
jgi:hypothetical protein